MIYKYIIFAMCLTTLCQGQNIPNEVSAVSQEQDKADPLLANKEVSLVLSSNALAFQIYREIKNGEENLVFSPYSLSFALGMAYTGADGSTQAQMARVLRLPLRSGSIANSFKQITKGFKRDTRKSGDDLIVNISNSLWIQRGQPILPLFAKSIADDFQGLLKSVDFSLRPEDARIEINTWISNSTQGKIPQLFAKGDIPNITRMLLLSTIYMRGKWQKPFNENFTQQTPFFPNESKSMTVPMMTVTNTFNYLKANDFAVVELPYDSRNAEGLNLSMYIFLPNKTFGLSNLENKIDEQSLPQWISKMALTKSVVSLPRFKVTSAFAFEEILSQLGMVAPFSDNADFSKINGFQDLKLSKIVQKCYITINEKGTEAAASTGVSIISKSIDTDKSEIFLADHPFMYFIIDKTTGGIIFMGKVSTPE